MRRSYYVVGLIFLTFFVISFLTNIIGPLVPEIIDDFANYFVHHQQAFKKESDK